MAAPRELAYFDNAFDNLIEYGIQGHAGAIAEVIRILGIAFAGGAERERPAMTHGQDEVATKEEVRFAIDDAAIQHLRSIDHDEQTIAETLDFRALVGFVGVFDGQRMQVEFHLHLEQQGFIRFEQADPDQTALIAERVRDAVEAQFVGIPVAIVAGDEANLLAAAFE